MSHISLIPLEPNEGNDLLYVFIDGNHVGRLKSCGESSWAVYIEGRPGRLTTTPTIFEACVVVQDYLQQKAA